MARPERRILLAGESPVRVSAGAPGSRPPPGEEIPWARAGRQKTVQRRATKRAATLSERCSLVTLSAERCLGGPSRSCHGESRQQTAGWVRNACWTSPGYGLAASFDRRRRNRRDPTRPPASGKDCAYKAGGLKSRGARRESEGSVLPAKACSKTRWREGLCQEDAKVSCCTRDEGRSLGVAL